MGEIISGDRQVAMADVRSNAARAASGLDGLGVQPGDAVAVVMRNDIAFFEATAAAGLLGAYAVPINWHYGAEETGYVLQDSGAKALVVHADLLPGIAAGVPDDVTVLVVPTPPEIAAAYGLAKDACAVPQGRTAWLQWLSAFAPKPPAEVPSPGSMIYTSGTTGRPKGVRRKPTSPEEMAALYATINVAFDLQPEVRTVIPAPMYHSAPNSYSLLCLNLDVQRVVLMPRFDAEDLLALVAQHRISHMQVVPTMFVRLLKLPEAVRQQFDLSSLRFVVHAAAPCPPDLKRAMIEWWGPVINEYYGSTETGAVVFCTSEQWLAHPGTVGKAMIGTEVRVLDEQGTELPAGTPGDVFCRNHTGPDFTYNNDDGKRAKAETAGLIGVGDIGYLDSDGFLYLCDRRNDMVISGGVNIYPAEIENCLITHPGVADCAVFGIPDEDFGEALCAWVQPAAGVTLDPADVRAHIAGHLAKYKVPKVVEFAADLPREDSGKIFKRKLREPYWQGVQ